MLLSISWFSTVRLHCGHGSVCLMKILSNPNIMWFLDTPLLSDTKPLVAPLAAACVCTSSVCGELPLHVCHGQASVCWRWKSPGWRNRLKHGAGNGRVSNLHPVLMGQIWNINNIWKIQSTYRHIYTYLHQWGWTLTASGRRLSVHSEKCIFSVHKVNVLRRSSLNVTLLSWQWSWLYGPWWGHFSLS